MIHLRLNRERKMAIEDFILQKTQQKDDTQAFTLRLLTGTVASIDELASTLSVTRQELVAELVKDSLERALKQYEEVQNKPDFQEQTSDGEEKKYVVLNTNKRHSSSDHLNIVNNGIAAAFYTPWKFKIDTLKKGDIVFLYETGVGIVGVGKANGQLEIKDRGADVDETHQQTLTDYKRVKPLSSSEIRKITGTNMVFLQTMFRVISKHGALIEKSLADHPLLAPR